MESTDTSNSSNSRAHILVVDDDEAISEQIKTLLNLKTNYRLSFVEDGQEAIDFLEAAIKYGMEIDLVLLDVVMPRVTGLEVLKWIRENPDLRYLRVVLLTATSDSNQKVEALSIGADDYITKPFYPQELLARVNTILRTQQLEKQLQRQSQQLAALNRVGQMVSASLETEEVMAAAVTGADQVLGVEMAAIWLLEAGELNCHLVGKGKRYYADEAIPNIPIGQGVVGTAYNEGISIAVNKPDSDSRFKPEFDNLENLDIINILAAPLIVRGQAVGVLSAYNKRYGKITDVDVDLYASLAGAVSEAIENSWLFQRIRLRQQELLEGRNTLQALIDGIPNPIYTIGEDWQLVAINKSKADELETTSEELIESTRGKACYEVLFDKTEPCEHCQIEKTLIGKQAEQWTVSWFGDDHLPREWEINSYPIPGLRASSARAVIVWQDKTEERRLEASLLQAGKLAAIGQLAAGVAHEINNPLTAINANAQMLKIVIPKDDENYEAIELINDAGVRAATVVRGLLDFARQEHYAFTSGDLNLSITQAIDLARYQLQSADVEVTLNFDEELPQIVASWEHLKSVWLNLIVNARDAVLHLPSERHIQISTNIVMEERQILAVFSDNGRGMSSAEIEHIFEPFYTTKDPGEGTGLGLATSHRIIEHHHGNINVVSTPDNGTTFIVRLPLDRPSDNSHDLQEQLP